MLKKKIFLVVGLDFSSRKIAIDNIKKRLIPQKYAILNQQVYYSRDIELDKLRGLLFNFSFGGKRIVIFRDSDRLSKEVKGFLYNNIKKITEDNYLVFELEKEYFFLKRDRQFIKDKLFGYLLKESSLIRISSFTGNVSIKKLLETIRKGRIQDALYILAAIFDKTDKNKDFIGMQILGAITRDFSYMNNPDKKGKTFSLIWDAERMLKGRKIESRIVIELLITKLILSYQVHPYGGEHPSG